MPATAAGCWLYAWVLVVWPLERRRARRLLVAGFGFAVVPAEGLQGAGGSAARPPRGEADAGQ